MARVLELFQSQYDYILIDCGHSMDLLTINALAAAHQPLSPCQAHYLAMEDMADTLEVIQTIRQGINPKLAVGGILLTMYQGVPICAGAYRTRSKPTTATHLPYFPPPLISQSVLQNIPLERPVSLHTSRTTPLQRLTPPSHKRCYPMARNKVQDALRQRKRSEAEAAMANGPPEEGAYQCFFNRDDLPSPMEGGTLCDFPLAQLSGFPDHEEHFPLYTGARLEDMVESIRRHGVQSPILVWKLLRAPIL